MIANRKKQLGFLLIVVVIAAMLAIAAGGEVAQAKAPYKGVHAKPNPPVVPPHASAFGKTYSEWAAEWWLWTTSIPPDENHPLIADGKIDCSVGQSGKVWFLGGSHTANVDPNNPEIILAEANRKCTIPVGKALYFPIVNIVCTNLFEPSDGETPEELAGCANYVIDSYVYPRMVKIDGVEIGDLESYRTISPVIDFGQLIDPNILGAVPKETGMGVTSGYYILIPPLSRGKHKIEFMGETIVEEWGYHFRTDTTYHLKVH